MQVVDWLTAQICSDPKPWRDCEFSEESHVIPLSSSRCPVFTAGPAVSVPRASSAAAAGSFAGGSLGAFGVSAAGLFSDFNVLGLWHLGQRLFNTQSGETRGRIMSPTLRHELPHLPQTLTNNQNHIKQPSFYKIMNGSKLMQMLNCTMLIH